MIRVGDELIVKRVVNDPEAGWLLVSDNPDKEWFPRRSSGRKTPKSSPR